MQYPAGDEPGDRVRLGVRVRADVQPAFLGHQLGPIWSAEHQAPTVRRSGGGARAAPASTHGGLAAERDLDAGGRVPGISRAKSTK